MFPTFDIIFRVYKDIRFNICRKKEENFVGEIRVATGNV